jgi:hypothetical protein
MSQIIHLLLKVFVGALGALAIYLGFFLYEDEEGKLQNRIEQLSQALKKRSEIGESLPLVSTVAGFINRILDRLLGKRLVSLRMVGVSICFSFASGYGYRAFNVYYSYSWRPATVLTHSSAFGDITVLSLVVPSLILALVCFGLGALASKYPSRLTTVLSYMPLLPLSFYFFTPTFMYINLYIFRFMIIGAAYGSKFPALFTSLLSDILLALIIRASLRSLLIKPTVIEFVKALIVQLGVVGVLVVIPFSLDRGFGRNRMTIYAADVTGLNIATGVAAVSFICVLLFFLLHKLFWPIASRIVYPIARFKVLLNRKFMFGSGIACFGVVSPPFATLLEKAAKLFH